MTIRFGKFKKKIAIITIFCMLFTLSMPINSMAAASTDISNHWAKGTIQSSLGKGFISGYPDGTIPDTIAPILQLIGSNPASTNLVVYETIPAVDAYADPGAVANDNVDGNITESIIVTGLVNTKTVGSNKLIYTVTDTAGNSTSVIRNVNVVERMDPETIPQFKTPLLIPWAMPKSTDPNPTAGTDYYEIGMEQFEQQILPVGFPKTTVWGYGSMNSADPNTVFHTPSLTIEATSNSPTRIKWVNGLVDTNGNYLPHLLPNDQTISSFPMELAGGMQHTPSQGNYVGPVPVVTHVHGAHVVHYSDGNPMAWYMPDSSSVADMGYATAGPSYGPYKAAAESGASWTSGNSVFDYTNDQRANTMWYHDHVMGLTRTNVYAGLAGFYLIRGGADDVVTKSDGGGEAILPGPAPTTKQQYLDSIATGNVYEVPIAIQDRTFNKDGSLWYPGSRAEFDAPEGYSGPYEPDTDVAPIWNPEFIGDTIIANGNTWPTMNVQPKMYRFKFLNGANARTFILGLDDITTPESNESLKFWQIGTDGGLIAAPIELEQLLMMPAERADVIVDFSKATVGDLINLTNVGPDGPFSGGVPGNEDDDETFKPADPDTTGLVMQFKVIASDGSPDLSTPPSQMKLPTIGTLTPTSSKARTLSLNEIMSTATDGPAEALLGTATVDEDGVVTPTPLEFMDDLTELINLNDTETWEIYNFTGDAHPIHLHLVEFKVVNRQKFELDEEEETGKLGEDIKQPEVWETGYKDTVIAYPNQMIRIKAKFDMVGQYVWHCHILDHEDNEMMREFKVQ